jgi:hypothetical protein
MRLVAIVLLIFPQVIFAAERTLRFTAPVYFLPPVKSIVLTKTGDPGPGAAKHAAVVSVAALKDEAKLPSEGPFDIWYVPKDGKPIKAVGGWKAKDGANEIKLNDYLGVIAFRGDGQPRGKLLVTSYDDPGPELKGHVVVQSAQDTRAELAVLPGDYALWIVPESGARARRVVDKIRVQAGKTATAD